MNKILITAAAAMCIFLAAWITAVSNRLLLWFSVDFVILMPIVAMTLSVGVFGALVIAGFRRDFAAGSRWRLVLTIVMAAVPPVAFLLKILKGW